MVPAGPAGDERGCLYVTHHDLPRRAWENGGNGEEVTTDHVDEYEHAPAVFTLYYLL